MNLSVRQLVKFLVIPLVLTSLLMSQMAYAQGPQMTRDELKQALVQSAETRKENLAQVRSFFSTDMAQKAFATAKLDSGRIDKAVATLDANELAKLAAQTRQVQNDFAAGALTNQQITYILIALGTAIVVLIAVH
jgi:hypothetical protein